MSEIIRVGPNLTVLFSEDKNAPKPHGRPHSTKLDVYGAIADAMFKDDVKYADSYVSTPHKFHDSVAHRLEHLKSKYHEYAAWFVQTGNGVDHCILGTGPAYDNILEFPWFSDLHGLWRAIPSYSAKPITSTPGIQCDAQLLSLVQKSVAMDIATSPPLPLTLTHAPTFSVDEGRSHTVLDSFEFDLSFGLDTEMQGIRPPASGLQELLSGKQQANSPPSVSSSPPCPAVTELLSVTTPFNSRLSFCAGAHAPPMVKLRSQPAQLPSTQGSSSTSSLAWDGKSMNRVKSFHKSTEALQQNVMHAAEAKIERIWMKLEYQCHEHKCNLLCEQQMVEQANATIVFQHEKEQKEADIQLAEAQAEVLRLKIELAKLEKAG
ncbi:hypothetical protein EDD17DRAFT_1766862 [Pisolithus thermaeus]|nr:hypothetical protein EV401DRAFT_2080900 [Pisolithus croceorrhizus]KAI6148231.1 hypothetical protein EDD17DRAFT_1766862 [Pisolithus thermaeus]